MQGPVTVCLHKTAPIDGATFCLAIRPRGIMLEQVFR